MVEVTVRKCKVGPVTKVYRDGEYQSVDRERDGMKRLAILGLDNSHNKDYKVAYASDPVLSVIGGRGVTHDQIEAVLRDLDVWELADWTAIEVPHGAEWKAAYKSLPRDTGQFSLIQDRVTDKINSDNLFDSENSVTFYK